MAKNKKKTVNYPIVRDGKYVCSDGAEYSSAYRANEHEKSITKKNR